MVLVYGNTEDAVAAVVVVCDEDEDATSDCGGCGTGTSRTLMTCGDKG